MRQYDSKMRSKHSSIKCADSHRSCGSHLVFADRYLVIDRSCRCRLEPCMDDTHLIQPTGVSAHVKIQCKQDTLLLYCPLLPVRKA